ncbi:two-component system response regulator BaeR [Inhella inkyongensis]|uniref:Two-component system response regulator BaeR n=1 Tax=Inhella inkyongensis TaxID=392593 RepID=A0A840S3I9_9BURK|nr:response regulator [Inhella inkyongensis]MBB5205807.1 two-component system response regulator BaeR [Inhella inkyongensis]
MSRILVVEDDPAIAALLSDYLAHAGLKPETCADGLQAWQLFERAGPWSAVVLDLMLPGLDGLQLCQRIRAGSAVPILMATARIDEFDRLLGLEIGADDYLCKPYSPREVVARVRALLRRAEGRLVGQAATELPGTGGFSHDEAGQRLGWRGQWLNLTPVEYRLLRSLLQQPGRVFERATLLDALHADAFRDVSDRVIDSHIKNLRRKLEALLGQATAIQAVYGVGYRFTPPLGA